MRLVFFDDYRLGLVQGDRVHDVTAALGDPSDAAGRALSGASPQERLLLLIGGLAELRPRIDQALERGAVRALKGLRLRAPVPRPMKLICAARNYRENGVHESVPIEFFLKSPEAILDPGGTVELPSQPATIFHHEAELAVVIGRTARRVPAADALDYVFAYTPFVDVSARGLLPRSFFSGKSFDTFAPIGPALVTADELSDPQRLTVELDVNGEPRQRFGTDDMANSVADLIAAASAITTLRPGDVIATGTNHQGLGALQDGDQVELRIAIPFESRSGPSGARNDPSGARNGPDRSGTPAHDGWPTLAFSVRDPLRRSWPRGVDEETATRARQPASS